jgi:hypothetical protein
MTSGVKVMTYFNLHVKSSYPHQLREMRELHHLAACLDLVRKGDLARAADGLAARFIAIHQSLVDGARGRWPSTSSSFLWRRPVQQGQRPCWPPENTLGSSPRFKALLPALGLRVPAVAEGGRGAAIGTLEMGGAITKERTKEKAKERKEAEENGIRGQDGKRPGQKNGRRTRKRPKRNPRASFAFAGTSRG